MKTVLFGVSLAALVAATAANAQDQSVETAAQVDDIIVTAQRRSERLQDVPVSITAFSEEALRRADITDISRLSIQTPGLTFGKSSLESRPAIRGVRTENVAANGDPTIGFYVDDIYQSRAVQAGQPFIDVSRVEVQRGPQGTLYGRNTFGGNIAVTTNAPEDEFDYGLQAVAGNFDRYQIQGFVNAPVSEDLAVRLAAFREIQDGYVKNTAGASDLFEKDTTYLRASARYARDDRFEATVRANYWNEEGSGGQAFGYKAAGGFVNPTTGARTLGGTVVRNIVFNRLDGIPDINGIDIGTQISDDPYEFDGNVDSDASLTQYAGSIDLQWNFGSFGIRSITGYQQFDYLSNYDGDQLPISTGGAGSQLRENEALSQEFQVFSQQDKPLQWIAGLFLFDDSTYEVFRSDLITNTGYVGPVQADTLSYAAFAQASYYLNERLRLTAGARYTRDDKDYAVRNINNVNGVQTVTSEGSFSKAFSRTTYRLGADLFVTPENMVYASISTGFRSGGFNGGALTNPNVPFNFAPETVTAYEVGTKNRFFDGQLQINTALYFNDFTDLQVQNQFLVLNTTLSAIRNAGAATSKGGEVEIIARPTEALTLMATATIQEAVYDEYVTGAPSGYSGTFISLAGNDVPYTPRHKFTFGAEYEFDLGANGTITPFANVALVGEYYNTDFNTELDKQDQYVSVDASVAWRSASGRYGVEAYGNNLTDEAVISRGVFGSSGLNLSYEPPRMFGVRLIYNH